MRSQPCILARRFAGTAQGPVLLASLVSGLHAFLTSAAQAAHPWGKCRESHGAGDAWFVPGSQAPCGVQFLLLSVLNLAHLSCPLHCLLIPCMVCVLQHAHAGAVRAQDGEALRGRGRVSLAYKLRTNEEGPKISLRPALEAAGLIAPHSRRHAQPPQNSR